MCLIRLSRIVSCSILFVSVCTNILYNLSFVLIEFSNPFDIQLLLKCLDFLYFTRNLADVYFLHILIKSEKCHSYFVGSSPDCGLIDQIV